MSEQDHAGAAALVERLAALSHEQWAGWASWMVDKWDQWRDDGYGGEHYQARWKRQIATPYADLSESEKESDRIEARKVIDAVQPFIDAAVAERTAALEREVATLRPIADAALAWEQARQSIWQPGQFAETHPKEMSDRMHAHAQREKELRALLVAALSAPVGQGEATGG